MFFSTTGAGTTINSYKQKNIGLLPYTIYKLTRNRSEIDGSTTTTKYLKENMGLNLHGLVHGFLGMIPTATTEPMGRE